MHYQTKEKLKHTANAFFDGLPDPVARCEIERMYQAFKARLIVELEVCGGSNQGVVYGHLEDRAQR